VDSSERVTVPVRINGAGPFNFVVDTGANRTVVSSELAATLKLRDGGPADIHGVAGVESAPTALIDLFQADAVTARGLRAPVLPRDRLGADGLLGVDVLYNRRMRIDFIHHQITIIGDHGLGAEPDAYDSRRAEVGIHRDLGLRIAVPARYRFGQLIIIGADVSGHGVTAFVDSGSQSTVGNNALRRVASLSGVSDPKAARQMTPILSATGQTAEGEVSRLPLLRIGGLDITGLTTVFADLHVFQLWDLMKRPSLLLGMDVLRRFNAIELNYAQREVVFYLPARGHTD
jgi:predicted aspartyl protease